jgi:hypothetical protein
MRTVVMMITPAMLREIPARIVRRGDMAAPE